jgi:hypothetical protein
MKRKKKEKIKKNRLLFDTHRFLKFSCILLVSLRMWRDYVDKYCNRNFISKQNFINSKPVSSEGISMQAPK